jgi:hypothetical protein
MPPAFKHVFTPELKATGLPGTTRIYTLAYRDTERYSTKLEEYDGRGVRGEYAPGA